MQYKISASGTVRAGSEQAALDKVAHLENQCRQAVSNFEYDIEVIEEPVDLTRLTPAEREVACDAVREYRNEQ
jgi:hypothetical protein